MNGQLTEFHLLSLHLSVFSFLCHREVLSKQNSALLGPVSLICLLVGTYCTHESNIFHNLSAETVYPIFVLGSLLTPISWGLHVAAWIQKQNGN